MSKTNTSLSKQLKDALGPSKTAPPPATRTPTPNSKPLPRVFHTGLPGRPRDEATLSERGQAGDRAPARPAFRPTAPSAAGRGEGPGPGAPCGRLASSAARRGEQPRAARAGPVPRAARGRASAGPGRGAGTGAAQPPGRPPR